MNTYEKRKRKEELKHQIISFALMIFLTLVAFIEVKLHIAKTMMSFSLLVLAVVQVIFQLYYFMHAKERGHNMVMFFIYGGVFVATTIILAFTTIIWWN